MFGVNLKTKRLQIVAVYTRMNNGERHKWQPTEQKAFLREILKERKKNIQFSVEWKMVCLFFLTQWSTKASNKEPKKVICNGKNDWKYPAAQSNLFLFNI